MLSSALKSARNLSRTGCSITRGARNFSRSSVQHKAGGVSLTDFLPGTPEVDLNAKALTNPLVTSSTLSNGLTVITQDVPYLPVSNVGIFVNAGSRVETSREAGASHVIQSMAFKSTVMTSELMITREFEKTGASVNSQSSRETILYNSRCLREAVPRIVELLSEVVIYPRLGDLDIEGHRDTIKNEIEDYMHSPEFMVNENLHAQAFRGSPLASPLLCPPHNLVRFTGEVLGKFHEKWYTPSGIVISAVNYDHGKMVELAKQYFGTIAPRAATPRQASKYVGGEAVVYDEHAPLPHDASRAYIALGFESVGARHSDAYATSVLQSILGRGNNIGIHDNVFAQSRLDRNVLRQSPAILSANTFNLAYGDTGVFGVYFETESASATQSLQAISGELKKTAESLTNEEVEQAKKAVQINYLNNMTSNTVAADSHYTDMKLAGKLVPQADALAKIQAVSRDDVKRVLQRALSSKPTVSAYGELYDFKL